MIKTMYLSVLAILFFVVASQAQKFEGKITFKITEESDKGTKIYPSSMIYQVKDSTTHFQSGLTDEIIIVNSSEKNIYLLKKQGKWAYKMPIEKQENVDEYVVTKEKEVIEILNYKCQKYKVLSMGTTQYIWATKDINIAKTGVGIAGDYLIIDGVKGFPLKIQNITKYMKSEGIINTTTQIFEATEITKELQSSDFSIPDNYTIEETTLEEYGKEKSKIYGGY